MKHSRPYGPEDFARDTHVSRETLERLKAYASLLLAWNRKINLVAKSTEADLWRRHFLDSAQLYPLIPQGAKTLVDLGSGAGFPGLILAVMGITGIHLVESDQRKAAFLREAARVASAAVTIHPARAEDMPALPADVVMARALAPLSELLALGQRFAGPGTVYLLLKGQNVEAELTEAHKIWDVSVERQSSRTDPTATVLCLREVQRVQSG